MSLHNDIDGTLFEKTFGQHGKDPPASPKNPLPGAIEAIA